MSLFDKFNPLTLIRNAAREAAVPVAEEAAQRVGNDIARNANATAAQTIRSAIHEATGRSTLVDVAGNPLGGSLGDATDEAQMKTKNGWATVAVARGADGYAPDNPHLLARRAGAGSTPGSASAGTIFDYNTPVFGMNDPQMWRDSADPRLRPYRMVTVDTLRQLAETYDVLAACIAHLKSEVIRTPLRFVPKDDEDTSAETKRQIKEAQEFFDTDGGCGGFGKTRSQFEGEWLDDLIVIGCAAIYSDYRTRGALRDRNPDKVAAIDASTIKPLLTPFGFPPEQDAAVYEQVVKGVSWRTFQRHEMYYSGLPIFARSHTPYPLSMVELLVMCVFTALKSDEWNRTWLTDGNVPDEWMKLPPEMTADQAQSWLKLFNQMLSGNSRQRHKVKVTPGEITGRASRKDSDFQEFEFWMRDRTCSLMGVNPASIGHHSRQYKDSQGDAMDSTRENRVPALVGFRNDAYNDVCKRKGLDKIKATDQEPGEEDATARAERHKIEIESGQRTPNECRQDDGQEPYDGGDVHLVSSTLVPVTQLAAAPEAAPGTGPDDGSTPGADTAAGDAGQGGQASEENGDEETEAGNAEADSADGIFPAVARFVVARGTFEEAKHPRTHGKFASKGGAAPTTDKQPAVTKPAVAKQSRAPVPQLSEKAQRAKAAHHMVDKDIQRYAEDHNEPAFAKSLGGIAFKDNEPVDVVVPGPKGTLAHGIELKTVVSNKNAKITMKKSAMALKTDWEKRHKAPVHTVVLDDTAVFNANGPGQHDLSGRKVYYRRGFGSFRIGGMHPVENLKELKQLLDMPDDELPAAARPKRVKE